MSNTFTTKLSKLIDLRLAHYSLDGYALEDGMVSFTYPNYLDPRDYRNKPHINIDMSTFDLDLFVFVDQDVVLVDGETVICDEDGHEHTLYVTVERPITKEDLAS